MSTLFGLIFYLSFPFLIVGMIKPKLFARIRIDNRKKVFVSFVALFFASVIGSSLTIDIPDDGRTIYDPPRPPSSIFALYTSALTFN